MFGDGCSLALKATDIVTDLDTVLIQVRGYIPRIGQALREQIC